MVTFKGMKSGIFYWNTNGIEFIHKTIEHNIHHLPRCSQFSSVQFSCSVVSESFWPHGLQHTRLSCPSPTLRTCSNSCLLSWWSHPTMPSSVILFSSCSQFSPGSGSFQCVSSSHQVAREYWSFSFSISPSNEYSGYDWFPLGLTACISLQSKGLSRVFSNTTVQKSSILWCSAFFIIQLSHPCLTTRKTIALTRWIFLMASGSAGISPCLFMVLLENSTKHIKKK